MSVNHYPSTNRTKINDLQGIAGQARNDKVMKGVVTPDLIRGRNDKDFLN
jgi:hypothetical protein